MTRFKFNFDDNTQKMPELTTKNQKWLRQIEMKINGIQANVGRVNPLTKAVILTEGEIQSSKGEIVRLEAAYKDVQKRMSKEEKAEYKSVMKAISTQTLSKEEIAARNKQMDQNKDRPSH